jgi:ADP-ribose pyrophosphatase YjhB (NUDIX family)
LLINSEIGTLGIMSKQATRFQSAITWRNEHCDVLHSNTKDFSSIPYEHIQKVHGVCFCDGKMLVVYHEEWDIWGIPGGSKEEGEEIIRTLGREIREESACRLVSANPVAYQQVLHSDGSSYYALLYHCEVVCEDDFTGDIAGSITKVAWIDPEEYGDYLEDKAFRRVAVQSVLEFRSDKES